MEHRILAAARAVRNALCGAVLAAGALALPAAPALLPLALADCAGTSAGTISMQVVDDAAAVANGFLDALPGLKAIPGVDAALLSRVTIWAEDIESAAQTLGPGLSQAEAQPTIRNIVTLAGDIIAAFPAGILPPGVSIAFAAVQVLLPVLLAAVGVSPTARMTMPSAAAIANARHVLGER